MPFFCGHVRSGSPHVGMARDMQELFYVTSRGRLRLCVQFLAKLGRVDGFSQVLEGFPNHFFCDSWAVGFWEDRPCSLP